MSFVIDASVAIKLYVFEDMHDAAHRLVAEAGALFAPASGSTANASTVPRNPAALVPARVLPMTGAWPRKC